MQDLSRNEEIMRIYQSKLLISLAVLATTLFSWQARAEGSDPRQVVETTAIKMTERLISDREKVQTQEYYIEHLVDEILLPAVDHTYMARRVLAKNWKKASTDQKQQFVEAFKHKVIRTYAGAFKAFNGEKLIFSDAKFSKTGKKSSVGSKIQRIGAPPIDVTYKLYLKDDQWLTYDIVIEGVSLVKSFHDQFSQRIEKDGLAQAISELAKEYKSETPRLKMVGHVWEPYISQHLPANGLIIDLLTEVFTRAGYQVEMEFMPWSRVAEEMRNGSADISVASWYSDTRAQELSYSEPYLTNNLIILKRKKDALKYNNFSEFKSYMSKGGYRMGVFEEYAYGDEFNSIAPLVNLSYYKHCGQLVRDVAAKNTDIALIDQWTAETKLNSMQNIADHLEMIATPIIKRGLYITASKQNKNHQQIIAAFNKTLQDMKSDGSYNALLKRHNYSI